MAMAGLCSQPAVWDAVQWMEMHGPGEARQPAQLWLRDVHAYMCFRLHGTSTMCSIA